MLSSFKQTDWTQTSGGFTVFEMMVVISIFLVMTGVAIANLPAFRDKTFVDLVAQEIAVTIRQAQVYGAGTRAANGIFPSHGIIYSDYLDPDKKSFRLFVDRDDWGDGTYGDGAYGNGSGCGQADDECVEKFTIQGAAEIPYIAVCQSADDCDYSGDGNQLAQILFLRPYPEAQIIGVSDMNGGDEVGCGRSSEPSCTKLQIHVRSIHNPANHRVVEVWNTGHIVVKDP